jgi:glycosyltransferase involved in cell wall biosynthesis
MGHDVTLFASGDSVTAAKLIPACARALRLDPQCTDKLAHHIVMLDDVMQHASEFDIIHFHIDYLHFPVCKYIDVPWLSTVHGRLDLRDLIPLYRRYISAPITSISLGQRKPLAWANWAGNVYHGIPVNLHAFRPKQGDYLAFLGRMSPEKRPDRAIEIAVRTGMHLKMAAKIDAGDRAYFESQIKPLMHYPNVEYIGEITEKQKGEFLGNAYAYLFPIDWPEPFGLTMIEAMACGTPTIAYNCGSVPEVITNGVSGFIVSDLQQTLESVEQVSSMDRAGVRKNFEERFTSSRMAREYLAIYDKTIAQPVVRHAVAGTSSSR